MAYYVSQTFFRPPEIRRIAWTLPAPIYNLSRLILRDSEAPSAFVALRPMQFLAVIDTEEIIFVDGNGDYRVHNGEGGRIIKLAWQNFAAAERDSLDGAVPCNVVFYSDDAEPHFRRIMGLIGAALDEHRAAKHPRPETGANVIPLS